MKTETKPAWKPADKPQFLSVDLFFIDRDGYLIAVVIPLNYTAVVHIPNRKMAALRGALWKILGKIDQQHYEVSHILTDNEGGIAALFPELERAGYGINPAGAGDHVPTVERESKGIPAVNTVHSNVLAAKVPGRVLCHYDQSLTGPTAQGSN